MSAAPKTRGIREYYTQLDAGRELWHVHAKAFGGDSFNPYAKGRFSGIEATPPRQMYYAGTTPECALWETTLRDVVPTGSVVSIDPALYRDSLLARIQLKEDVPMLDLRSPNIRNLSEDQDRWDRWQELTVTPSRNYSTTHEAAAELLTAAPKAAGLMWRSRQSGQDTAMVLYKGPLGSAGIEVLEETALDSPRGLALIDKALSLAYLKRANVGALAAAIGASLPPTNPVDGDED